MIAFFLFLNEILNGLKQKAFKGLECMLGMNQQGNHV
jgi:hypothetical protein